MILPTHGWAVEHRRGSVGALHRPIEEPPAVPTFVVNEPTDAALVLGSAQRIDVVDTEAAAAAGIDVVVRRSGGGAVLVVPGGALWVDLLLPGSSGDLLADAVAVGRWWAEALAHQGVTSVVHDQRSTTLRWSSLVCFAGLGPGELTIDGAKALGLSQRRTRSMTRIQILLLLQWQPDDIVSLLRLERFERDELRSSLRRAATGVDVDPFVLVADLTA